MSAMLKMLNSVTFKTNAQGKTLYQGYIVDSEDVRESIEIFHKKLSTFSSPWIAVPFVMATRSMYKYIAWPFWAITFAILSILLAYLVVLCIWYYREFNSIVGKLERSPEYQAPSRLETFAKAADSTSYFKLVVFIIVSIMFVVAGISMLSHTDKLMSYFCISFFSLCTITFILQLICKACRRSMPT